MTARLEATGKQILQRSRSWLVLPSPPRLPPAYTSLLLDPAELLSKACDSIITDSAVIPQSADRTSPPRTKTKPTALQNQPFPQALKGSRPPAAAARNNAAPPASTDSSRHTNPPSRTTSRSGQPASSAPISLPVASRVRPTAANSFHAVAQANLSTEPSATSNVKAAAREIRPQNPPPSFGETRRADTDVTPAAPNASETSPLAPVPAAASSRTSRPVAATNASGRVTRIGQSFPAWQPTDETTTPHSADGEEAFTRSSPANAGTVPGTDDAESVVHFAHSTSRLAGLLKANLTNPAAASPPAEPPGIAGSAEASPLTDITRPRLAGVEAGERGSADEVTEDGAPLSVEAVIEELYERLRLEFLRTYGTAGE